MAKCFGDSGKFIGAIVLILSAAIGLSACSSAQQHSADVAAAQGASDNLTVGTVQREIRVGMSGGEVASILGSPNIVTTDENRQEVWVYDRISTDTVYSTSSGGVSALILGGLGTGSGIGGGAGSAGYSSSAGAVSKNQKTLTIVIKFGEDKLVRDFAYHSSSF